MMQEYVNSDSEVKKLYHLVSGAGRGEDNVCLLSELYDQRWLTDN